MNTTTITDKLHARSDELLRKHIEDTISPIWNACKDARWDRLRETMAEELKPFGDRHWIGTHWKDFTSLAFIYMRDAWREKAVLEFMEKVEAVSQIREEIQSLSN